jgi:hypothetical protein
VKALAVAPSIAEEPSTMTENSTTLSDEDMHTPSYVGNTKRKKSYGWGGRGCLSVKGRGARREVLNSTRNSNGISELNTTTIPYIFKIATVNINGISADNRMRMFEGFLYKNDIDIVLLQEVTLPNITAIHRYTAHINIGTEGRGTAIIMKAELTARNVIRSPTGRGIALEFNGVWIINV